MEMAEGIVVHQLRILGHGYLLDLLDLLAMVPLHLKPLGCLMPSKMDSQYGNFDLKSFTVTLPSSTFLPAVFSHLHGLF